MDEIDFIEELADTSTRADEQMRLKVAFGDDVAQRFLRLRGIVGELMQEAVLARYAAKQAARLTRDALAAAASVDAPMPAPGWARSMAPAALPAPADGYAPVLPSAPLS
jgi:hypothetical protein